MSLERPYRKEGEPSYIGGPACGATVPRAHRCGWTVILADAMRGLVHTYERNTPNDKHFYYRYSRPIFSPAPGDR